MSRIRSIHPGLFTDDRYMGLTLAARELLKGLWCEADDQGVFAWRPLTLKARILPADMINVAEVLVELEAALFIQRFEYGGSPFGAIRNFRKYQRPKKPSNVHYLPDELCAYVGLGDPNDPGNLRRELCDAQGGKCFYCSAEITYYSKRHNSLDIDHRVPTSRGGSDARENLVAACRACNRGKSDRTEAEWLAILSAKNVVPMPNSEYRNAKAHFRDAKAEFANPKGEKSPQREEVGGRKEEESESKQASRESVAAREAACDGFAGQVIRLSASDMAALRELFPHLDVPGWLGKYDERWAKEGSRGSFKRVKGFLERETPDALPPETPEEAAAITYRGYVLAFRKTGLWLPHWGPHPEGAAA